jgi:hypothetical protein
MRVKPAAALAVLSIAACIPEEGPLMSAGEDCLECHGGGEAPRWTVAGTAPDAGRGSRVTITDANGWTFDVRTAENGNFYTAEPVALPLAVAVDGRRMEPLVPADGCVEAGRCCSGARCGCNDCHGPGQDH